MVGVTPMSEMRSWSAVLLGLLRDGTTMPAQYEGHETPAQRWAKLDDHVGVDIPQTTTWVKYAPPCRAANAWPGASGAVRSWGASGGSL